MLLINEDERDVENGGQVVVPSVSLLHFEAHQLLLLLYSVYAVLRICFLSLGQSLLGRSAENQSTWQGLWKKVRLLVPYMWPQGSKILQLLVLFCLGLLGVERVVNVFVPIYSKNIGE